jgi:gp16 family phage-associated protein
MPQISSTDLEQVRSRFFYSGESVAGWARTHGFDLQLTYSVLSGRLRARRGKAHEIAIALGLKPADCPSVGQCVGVIDPREEIMNT